MNKKEILKKIRQIRVMPLFYHEDAGIAKKVMKAVFEGGIDLMEFTNRGKNAFNVFCELQKFKSAEFPDSLLGIGSIVDKETALQYIESGTDFLVSPLLNREVLEVCNENEILSIPGCSTLTEIYQAETWGAELLKVFPAVQLGGPAYIKSIKAPCPWLSIVVTGGVKATKEDLKAWHDSGVDGFGLGSDLISKELINQGNYTALTEKVRELVSIVQELE